MRRAMAKVSAQGSGSSCRSLDGPWVEWNPERGIAVIDGGSTEWMDFVFLIESGPKEVPSSEAHVRVKSSPQFSGRVARAEKRLAELKTLLKKNPDSIRYMTSLSEEIVAASQTPKFQGVATLDAGANVHLFVPLEQEAACEQWIQNTYPQVKYLKDVTGYGAHYEE